MKLVKCQEHDRCDACGQHAEAVVQIGVDPRQFCQSCVVRMLLLFEPPSLSQNTPILQGAIVSDMMVTAAKWRQEGNGGWDGNYEQGFNDALVRCADDISPNLRLLNAFSLKAYLEKPRGGQS